MGFSSFTSAFSGKSIPVNSPVVIILPDNSMKAGNYDGYGRVMCGNEVLSVYNLIAQLNGFASDNSEAERNKGIDLFFQVPFLVEDSICKYPLKMVRTIECVGNNLEYDELNPSQSCKYQGWFYPNEKAIDEVQYSE